MIAPTQFAALGPPISDASKSVKIIGIDSAADTDVFTSFLTTDNVQGGRKPRRTRWAAGDQGQERRRDEGDVALLVATSPASVRSIERAKGFKEELAAKYPGPAPDHRRARRQTARSTSGLNATSDLLTADPKLVGDVRVEPHP